MRASLWHTLTPGEALKRLGAPSAGLKFKDIKERQRTFGFNTLPTKRGDGWFVILVRQFISPMIIILIVAALISLALGEMVDAGVILAAIVVNTIIGFFQEFKANRSLEKLRLLVQPQAAVLRNGKNQTIPARDLVPGDILVLRTGDRVTADARIIKNIDISANEAALTGESFPVEKRIDALKQEVSLAERTNMVYTGTNIVGGRGLAVVVATGVNTELGKIAKLVEETQDVRTPLQEQLGRLSRWLAVLVGTLVVVLVFIGLGTGQDMVEMFEMAVALAVAAIPEGLIVSVTIILAVGMRRVLHRKSLVRKLVAAETLGSVSIICSDKTGTITQGEMRVARLVTPNQTWIFPFPAPEAEQESMRRLVQIMALCNDSKVTSDGELRGSPTERALLAAVLDQGIDPEALAKKFPRVGEIPFDSIYKYHVTAHQTPVGVEVFCLGAPDSVLDFCDHIQIDGTVFSFTDARARELKEKIRGLARQGIRLLAVARKISDCPDEPLERERLSGFTYLGLVGLRDPLRAQARNQIEAAKKAGIRTVIITGDHPETARAIATEAGLVIGPESVVVGRELDKWNDEELKRRVSRIVVYARVEPRHKIRIVRAWQERGEVVAMTGDGVNDAPALKAADIGVAVGSGTEVAKQASDIVILDNDLGTITAAIEEGRVIFDNIRKTTVYLLADSFTEIILIGGSILLGLPIPLLPVQILWINLVADSFPNIGLMLEPAEKDVMNLPPRPRDEAVLNKEMMFIIFVIGAVTDLILFALYAWLLGTIDSISEIRSIMFAAVGIDSLFYIFAVKSFRRTIFHINPFSNLWLLVGVLISFGLMFLALINPFFQFVFEITPLHLYDWGLLIMIGVVKLLAIEITKEIFLFKGKKINQVN